MGLETIILTVLGIPVSWLTSLTYEKIKAFSGKIETIPLQGLFINSFLKSLDRHKKDYAQGVKKLKKSIKQEGKEAEFLKIFSANAESYNSLISALQNETFQKTVAQEIVDHFAVEDNFREVMVLIVRDCLIDYRALFLKTMTEKQGIQLLILLQGQYVDVILNAIETLEEKLFSRFKKLVDRETEKDKPTIELKIKPKQIKILSITASPEGENYLLYEQEQDTLLEVFKFFDRQLVFLDMPDPVKSTLTEIREHLEDGYHDILHITAHGGINEKGAGVISLEDHQGDLEQVTGEELIKVLNPAPKIVILSACHSARKEPDLMPAARALFDGGIETVIGMKKAVSHLAAIEFNAAFFNALCQKKNVKQAFESGKQAILIGEQKRIKEIPGWDAVNEYEIPQLLAKDENLTVENFSDHRIEAPGRPESHHFLGAKYLERGFIGRRQVLRDIFKSIENKQGAVVLKGPGGIGKSTLTTRTAANLRRKGYDFMVVRGETTIEQILEIISKKAAALGVKDAEAIYAANAEPNEKLNWYLDQFLLKQKLVIILDNFEENQEEEKPGEFRKERLKKFLWFFRDSLQNHETFLFFSTRYTLPGFDSPDMTKNIPEFSTVEFRKMLLNSQALKQIDGKSVRALMEDIGGNPRALELLDKIAYKKYKKREFTWEQLKDLIPKLRERIIEKKGKGDDFTPLFLDTLFSYQDESQRHLLDILSIYRDPVPGEATAAQGMVMEDDDCTKLEDLSLLECIALEDKDLYYVHRLTAQYLLQQMKAAQKKRYHKKAAKYFAALCDEEGKIFLEDFIEARWHYLQAGEWNKAAEITFDLESYLTLRGYPQWAMELLGELELKKLKEENRAQVHHSIGILCGEFFGEYEQALFHYNQALAINEKIDNIKGVSKSLHQIGMIYQYKGDYDAALKQYHKSMEIFEKIGDIKGVSKSLHQIGMIYQDKGDYDVALRNYQQALEIFKKISDIANSAMCMAQMGTLHFKQNKFETALKQFIQAFMVFAKIGSPYANQARKYITRVREKLPQEQFNAILKEFNLTPEVFDKMDEEEQNEFMESLAAITKESVSAAEKSSEEKKKLADQLNQFIQQLPDAPETEGLKNYFQLLLAVVNNEDYQPYLEKVPEELKELFEKF